MKRKIFYGIVFILGVILMVAREYDKNNFKNLDLADDTISMEIKEGSLTRTHATVIITDQSPKANFYGEDYSIYKKGLFRWMLLPSKTKWFNAIAHLTDDNGKLELEYDWSYSHGKLEKGVYRLVKSVNMSGKIGNKYIYAEFQIK